MGPSLWELHTEGICTYSRSGAASSQALQIQTQVGAHLRQRLLAGLKAPPLGGDVIGWRSHWVAMSLGCEVIRSRCQWVARSFGCDVIGLRCHRVAMSLGGDVIGEGRRGGEGRKRQEERKEGRKEGRKERHVLQKRRNPPLEWWEFKALITFAEVPLKIKVFSFVRLFFVRPFSAADTPWDSWRLLFRPEDALLTWLCTTAHAAVALSHHSHRCGVPRSEASLGRPSPLVGDSSLMRKLSENCEMLPMFMEFS